MGRFLEKKSSVELTSTKENEYFERLIKYIPAEIVGLYISAFPLIISSAGEDKELASWLVYGGFQLFTPIYFMIMSKDKSYRYYHVIISSVAFFIWAYSLKGPFEFAGIYKEWVASASLVFFTLISGLIKPPN